MECFLGKDEFMRINRTALATLAAACMAVPVYGQATSTNPQPQPAGQAQVEQLQRDVSRLQAELDAVKQRQPVLAAQPAANPDEVEQLKRKVDVLEHEVTTKTGI